VPIHTADGLRVQQAMPGVVTAFAWDWATGVPELLTDGAKRYLIGHDTLGWADAAGWTYAVPDALGSVRQAVDGAGELVESRQWSPYGVESGAEQTGLGYTGEWWDAAVGLQYLRARWYDARTGAFLTRDAVEANHPYLYANGNPVLYTDPSGHDVGCPGGDAGNCAVPSEGGDMYGLAVTACRQGGWPTDCTLWQGVRWYLYFTSSPEAAEEYVNGTGLGAGEAGRQRAALAREWAQYLKYLGPNQGYEPAKDLRWWPTPENPSVSPAEFQLFVMYAFAGPAVAELSYELTCQFPWYAAHLGEAVYPNPGMWERPLNSKGEPYPRIIDPRTGSDIPFPDIEQLGIVSRGSRVDWTRVDREAFIREWHRQGYAIPDGGWGPYDIHHVQPRQFGGDNDFWNLVPLLREGPHRQFTQWWNAYP
jgi:RHS repeat-associated protein